MSYQQMHSNSNGLGSLFFYIYYCTCKALKIGRFLEMKIKRKEIDRFLCVSAFML